ncbi:hypothetical protein T05_5696 [Trichinella murrelli]|uniref:Uncharacterized protein n=1 Tax=Trichinella murrelli TaxID=144512 RepID=A0A0V0U0Z4_9BILA|nr:hypothetical protein T05_5696 [Trichinella murrelli]
MVTVMHSYDKIFGPMCDWLFLSGLLSDQNRSRLVPKGKGMSVQCDYAVNDQREKDKFEIGKSNI